MTTKIYAVLCRNRMYGYLTLLVVFILSSCSSTTANSYSIDGTWIYNPTLPAPPNAVAEELSFYPNGSYKSVKFTSSNALVSETNGNYLVGNIVRYDTWEGYAPLQFDTLVTDGDEPLPISASPIMYYVKVSYKPLYNELEISGINGSKTIYQKRHIYIIWIDKMLRFLNDIGGLLGVITFLLGIPLAIFSNKLTSKYDQWRSHVAMRKARESVKQAEERIIKLRKDLDEMIRLQKNMAHMYLILFKATFRISVSFALAGLISNIAYTIPFAELFTIVFYVDIFFLSQRHIYLLNKILNFNDSKTGIEDEIKNLEAVIANHNANQTGRPKP